MSFFLRVLPAAQASKPIGHRIHGSKIEAIDSIMSLLIRGGPVRANRRAASSSCPAA
jgi:hypothetical protein